MIVNREPAWQASYDRPWLSLPYGADVDVLVNAVPHLSRDDLTRIGMAVQSADSRRVLYDFSVRATDVLVDDRGARTARAVEVKLAGRMLPDFDHPAALDSATEIGAEALVVGAQAFTVAHLIGRPGISVESIEAAVAPLRACPLLAAAVGNALDRVRAAHLTVEEAS